MIRMTMAGDAVASTAGDRGTRLRSTDVHLWRLSLDGQPDEALAWLRARLSPDELDRATRFFFERDRRRFIVGRGILRVLLGRYVDLPPDEVAFRYGPNGKPELADADPRAGEEPIARTLHFNLAHSEGLALLAVTRAGPVGVDVESIRELPDWEHIAATCFTEAERARVDEAPLPLRPVEFFRAWTRQEARLKATGEGLGGSDRNRGREAMTGGMNPAFAAPRCGPLQVYSLQVASGYAAALAVPAAAKWATCCMADDFQWSGRTRIPRRSRRIPLAKTAEAGIGFL